MINSFSNNRIDAPNTVNRCNWLHFQLTVMQMCGISFVIVTHFGIAMTQKKKKKNQQQPAPAASQHTAEFYKNDWHSHKKKNIIMEWVTRHLDGLTCQSLSLWRHQNNLTEFVRKLINAVINVSS